MPAITSTDISGVGTVTSTVTTLNGSDSLSYTQRSGAMLILHNPTGGAISPVIDGDGATTQDVAGIGSVDLSAGFAVGSIAAGATVVIRLETIRAYLAGTIAINSGSGLEAQLLVP